MLMRTVSFCQDLCNPSLSRYFIQIIKQEKLCLPSSESSWHFVLIKCIFCRAIVLHIGVSWFLLGCAHVSLPAILDYSMFLLIIHLLVINKYWLWFFPFEDLFGVCVWRRRWWQLSQATVSIPHSVEVLQLCPISHKAFAKVLHPISHHLSGITDGDNRYKQNVRFKLRRNSTKTDEHINQYLKYRQSARRCRCSRTTGHMERYNSKVRTTSQMHTMVG